MNQEEKDYIDKKFSEMESKYYNPSPEEAWQRAKKYQNLFWKKYMKIYAIGVIIIILAMLYSFHLMGLL